MLEGKTGFRIGFWKDEENQGKYRRRRRTEVYFGHSVTISFSSRFTCSCNICVCWFIFMLMSVNKNRTNILLLAWREKGSLVLILMNLKIFHRDFYTRSGPILCLYELAQHHSTQCNLMPVYMADDLTSVYNKRFVSHSPNSWATDRGKVFTRFWE